DDKTRIKAAIFSNHSGDQYEQRARSVLSRQARRKYVNSLDDFYDHVVSHIERTVQLAAELKRLHPERYRDVDPGLLEIFMNRHDFAKIAKDETTGKRSFLEGLYQQYGRDFNSFSPDEKAMVLKYKDALNKADAQHARDFFKVHNYNRQFIKKNGHYTDLAKLYLEIESIADKVDRGLSPVSAEEFNRVKMKPASEFLSDPVQKRLAESLERSRGPGIPSPYEYATKGHTFEEFRARKARMQNVEQTCMINHLMHEILKREQMLPLRH
ncbi:MAG: hypothetical protein ACJ763_00005, partial [Bdellovibrionia bacterium]